MYADDDGFAGTAPVGSFPKGKTKFGANDFVGNVWEWTADWFETYKPDEQVDPKGPARGRGREARGGGFNGGLALWLNPAFRFHQLATASRRPSASAAPRRSERELLRAALEAELDDAGAGAVLRGEDGGGAVGARPDAAGGDPVFGVE